MVERVSYRSWPDVENVGHLKKFYQSQHQHPAMDDSWNSAQWQASSLGSSAPISSMEKDVALDNSSSKFKFFENRPA